LWGTEAVSQFNGRDAHSKTPPASGWAFFI